MDLQQLSSIVTELRRLQADLMSRTTQILKVMEKELYKLELHAPGGVPAGDNKASVMDFGIRLTAADYIAAIDVSAEGVKQQEADGGVSQSASALRHVSTRHLPNIGPTSRVPGAIRRNSAPKSYPSLGWGKRASMSKSYDHTDASPTKLDLAETVSINIASKRSPPNRMISDKLPAVEEGNLPFVGISIKLRNDDGFNGSKPTSPIQVVNTSYGPYPVEIVTAGFASQSKASSKAAIVNLNSISALRILTSISSSMNANTSQNSLILEDECLKDAAEQEELDEFILPPLSPDKHAKEAAFQSSKTTLKNLLLSDSKKRQSSISAKSSAFSEFQSVRDLMLSLSAFAKIFLVPAYDEKGCRISSDTLVTYGSVNTQLIVDGIHPRSLFSNAWYLISSATLICLLWLIPFVISYNSHELYTFLSPSVLSAGITVFFALDSALHAITPQVIDRDVNLDMAAYEKARAPLNIPFTLIFQQIDYYELLLLIPLARTARLLEYFSICPAMKYVEWRLDYVTGAFTSRITPITGAIFFFIHCNACTIYYMGRITGFIGWTALWPLFDHATVLDFYVWTFYKHHAFCKRMLTVLVVQYAVFLGAISSAVMAVNPSGRMFHQKIGELRDYIRWKDLSKETEQRLLSYYETKYRGKYFEEDAVLTDFNDSLKAGDSGSDMYFILTGKADVFIQGKYAVSLSDGAYFGGKRNPPEFSVWLEILYLEVGLITKTLRTATVQAMLPSVMYRLTYGDFHMILDDFGDMKVRIDMLAMEREKVLRMAEANR
ncbi:Potassium voltage-gated channel sub H member 7 [Chytriomyces hyalinus]|nr:Potassium voltage-gated channel sub H member 7 [Chytriomyces hyalinus]